MSLTTPSRRACLLGAVAALAATPLAAGRATSQDFGPGGPDRYFRFEWEKRGRKIDGYVSNTSHRWAARVRLLVEGLDVSATVRSRTTPWVAGGIPSNSRAFFEVPVPEAASYRLSVLSSEWTERRDLRSL